MTKLCILAGNYKEAVSWARSQNLQANDWFFPEDEYDLKTKTNFHVIVVGTAGENVPPFYFDRIYLLAQTRGRIGR